METKVVDARRELRSGAKGGQKAPGVASPQPPSSPASAPQGEGGAIPPYLREVRELVRQLAIAEKNFTLYPSFSRVVSECLAKLHAFARDFLSTLGDLRLEATQERLLYKGNSVYEEPEQAKSLSFRLHKDGVREVSFSPEVTLEELRDFLVCLKEARKTDEEDDDFVTMFWEKDAHNIELRLADDLLSEEEIPEVPEARSLLGQFPLERFELSPGEKEALERAAEAREAENDASSPFEITDEEAAKIRELVAAEARYIPVLDFADVLLEVMMRTQGTENLSQPVKMLRAIIASLIEDLDFERAALLMEKFSGDSYPALSEQHRRLLREMLETLTDRQTLIILETYLKEHDRLGPQHPIFHLMRAFPRSAAKHFCPFLKYEKHVAGVSQTLVHLASGQLQEYAKYLEDPDPIIVRAMIGVILEADKEAPVQRIAKALSHPDETVRISCAKAILEKGDSSSAPLFLPLLKDRNAQLRNMALEFFVKFPCPEAFEKLRELATGSAFWSLDAKRKRLCFSAILKSAPGRGLDFIARRVLRWPFCLGELSREKKTAAMEALALSGSEPARELLERWASRRWNKLSSVAERCLRTMETLQAKSKAAQQDPVQAKVSHAGTSHAL